MARKENASHRKPNIEFVERLDNGLRKGLGVGLGYFLPKYRLHCLQPGERRYMSDLNEGQAGTTPMLRSCIETDKGARRLESPQAAADGERHHLVIHLCCDMGSIGFPAANWMAHRAGLRCTLIFDLLHRRVCDWEAAVAEAGLRLLQAEFKQVLKMRQAPWGNSGNHSILVRAAEEVYALTDETNNIFFNILFPQVATELDLSSPDFGAPEHMKQVWKGMKLPLLGHGKGDNDKSSRWWAFEQNSRAFLTRRASTLCVLCWLGRRRGWWGSVSASPLNLAAMGTAPRRAMIWLAWQMARKAHRRMQGARKFMLTRRRWLREPVPMDPHSSSS